MRQFWQVIFSILFFIPASLFAAEGYSIFPGGFADGYVNPPIKSAFNVYQMMHLNNGNQRQMFVSNGCSQPLAFTCTTQLVTPVFTKSDINKGPFVPLSSTTNPFQVFVSPTTTPNSFNLGACPYVWVRSAGAAGENCAAGHVSIDFW